MVKRLLSAFLALLMIGSLVTITAFADNPKLTLSAEPGANTLTTLKKGDQVTVAIKLPEIENIAVK